MKKNFTINNINKSTNVSIISLCIAIYKIIVIEYNELYNFSFIQVCRRLFNFNKKQILIVCIFFFFIFRSSIVFFSRILKQYKNIIKNDASRNSFYHIFVLFFVV